MRKFGWFMVIGFTCLTVWAIYHAILELTWDLVFWYGLGMISLWCLGLTLRALGFASVTEEAANQARAPAPAPRASSSSAETVKDLR
jgi:hypothetical protein